MSSIHLSARIDHDKVWAAAGIFVPICPYQHMKEFWKKIFPVNPAQELSPPLTGARVKPATAWNT